MTTILSNGSADVLSPYLWVADQSLRIVSVFDDLKYDRADADMLSPAMRQHLVQQLKPHGFRQKSGTVLEHRQSGVRCIMPKFHALGASPFDITRFAERKDGDYFVLTPTQVACQFVDNYDLEDAVERIRTLINRHPINLFKLVDYLEDKPAHKDFLAAIGHLKYVQREAIEGPNLRRLRALGSMGSALRNFPLA
ncbi:MAG: hypothetical protein AAF830_11060 [Pseudomonadota bacterium]